MGCFTPNLHQEPLWHPWCRQRLGQGCPAPTTTSCPSLECTLGQSRGEQEKGARCSLSCVLQEEPGQEVQSCVCEGVLGWMSPTGAGFSLPGCCKAMSCDFGAHSCHHSWRRPRRGAQWGWDHPTESQRRIFSPYGICFAWHQLYKQLAPF